MQKSYCDCCGREMLPNQMIGVFTRVEISMTYAPGEDGQMKQVKMPRQINTDLCEGCQIAITEFINQKKDGKKTG